MSALFRLARLSRRPRRAGPTRRELLQATLAGTAGLLLSSRFAFGDDPPKGKRILVVGAGFAGLAAANELLSAGYDVTVLEARNRVGGRVLSFRDYVPGKNVEGGGELIGSNHPAWVAYADHFGLEFLDVTEAEEVEAPIHVGGKRVPADQVDALWEEIDAVCARMDADAEKVDADAPWTSPDAAALDAKTVKDWLAAQKDVSDFGLHAVDAQIASDNGVATASQSYLGMLASVKGGGLEKYWTDSEVYRLKGGNDLLAQRLLATVGEARVRLSTPVTAVKVTDKGVVVTLADGKTLEADDLVLAVPPSTWGKIAFDPPLPEVLKPQMGTNVKWLASVKNRFWLEGKLAADSLSDGDVSQTWDGTDNQPGEEGACLTCFSGGPGAENTRKYKKEERNERYLTEVERLYPGIRKSFVQARYMDWPSDPLTGAGYSFPAPGQVTTVGPALRAGAHGRLHFAGEHCCYAFVGYMEGGLQSGISAANRIAARDGVAVPAGAGK